MKNKMFIIAMYILLILFSLKLIFSNIWNFILINDYNNNKYFEEQGNVLLFLNFPESYVANYNYGNILYQKQEYEKAIEKYRDALKSFVPKYKECKIRINYALSICKTVKLDEYNQDEIKDAIEKYELAINVLTEKGCANITDDNGHSKEAETLKKDIQKEIEKLKKFKNSNDKGGNNDKTENQDTRKTIEEKIQSIKEKATQKQRETENKYKYYNKEFNMNKKNW